eukprot:761036-Lingulodinium_polyedra.AAC.1
MRKARIHCVAKAVISVLGEAGAAAPLGAPRAAGQAEAKAGQPSGTGAASERQFWFGRRGR